MGRFLMGFHALGISGVFKFIEPEFHFSKIEPGFSLQRSVFPFAWSLRLCRAIAGEVITGNKR